MEIINIFAPGHYDPYDSYGMLACRLAQHLDAAGVHVNALAHGYRERDNQTDGVKRITSRPVRPAFGGILLGYPTSYRRHGLLSATGPRIALSMFESSRLPVGWVEILNLLDAVVVPSTFCRDVFRGNGVNVPIRVASLGIDEVYQPRPETRPERPYTFLAIGDRGRRKGALVAAHAFHQAFGDSMDYRLVIKTRELEGNSQILNPNILVIHEDYTVEQMRDLFYAADVLVFPSKGEGFGLPPREFAATGGVSVATNWSGLTDHLPIWGIPLSYELVRADWQGALNLQGQELGEWAQPDAGQLTSIMREVAVRRDEYAAAAMRNAPLVHDLYSWDAFAHAVLDTWRQAAVTFAPPKEKEKLTHGNRLAAQPLAV